MSNLPSVVDAAICDSGHDSSMIALVTVIVAAVTMLRHRHDELCGWACSLRPRPGTVWDAAIIDCDPGQMCMGVAGPSYLRQR